MTLKIFSDTAGLCWLKCARSCKMQVHAVLVCAGPYRYIICAIFNHVSIGFKILNISFIKSMLTDNEKKLTAFSFKNLFKANSCCRAGWQRWTNDIKGIYLYRKYSYRVLIIHLDQYRWRILFDIFFRSINIYIMKC